MTIPARTVVKDHSFCFVLRAGSSSIPAGWSAVRPSARGGDSMERIRELIAGGADPLWPNPDTLHKQTALHKAAREQVHRHGLSSPPG